MGDKPLLIFALEQESQGLFSEYNVLYTGVGKVNAAYTLTRLLYRSRPKIVVNLGTAGSAVHKTGAVVHCTRFIQRDMDVSPLGFKRWQTPFSEQPVILEYGAAAKGLPHAVCGTGDSFDVSHDGAGYEVVDMEAYSLAQVCKAEGIQFLCLKYISDGADGKASEDWSVALDHAAHALRLALIQTLATMDV